jgi:hypothetical protein
VIQLLALLYVAYAVPLRVCFEVNVTTCSSWFFVDLLVDMYFIADVFMSFRTAYWAPNGVLVTKWRPIALQYLKGWFLIDAVSSFPLNYIILGQSYAESGSVPSTVRRPLRPFWRPF